MPPRFPSDLVGLDAQGEWIVRLAEREVGVVHAPAGYGKTAWCGALFTAAQAAGWRTAWWSVDESGEGAAMLGAAIGIPHNGENAEALAEYIDGAGRPFLFVVDNADRLNDPAAIALLDRLMLHPPVHLRLVLAGRAPPLIALDDIESRGMLLDIGRGDLALGDGEVHRFLKHAGVSLDARATVGLNRMLAGWPAALRLAVRRPERLRAMAATNDWTGLAVSLTPLVAPQMDALAEPARHLLRRSAVAPWLDGDLSRLLGGGEDGEAILRELAARDAVIDSIDGGEYCLHPAVRAVLAHGLDPDEAKQLHRIVGRYYASRGRVVDAIDQTIACGDLNESARLVAETAMPMIERGEIDPVAGWIDRLPPETAAAAPDLARARAWLDLLLGRSRASISVDTDEARAIDLLRRALGEDRADDIVETCDRILAEPEGLSGLAADMVRATLARGALGRGLFGLVHDAVRPLMLRNAKGALGLPCALAFIAKAGVARAQGQLGEAERLLREAKARQTEPGLAAALIDAALARACYERDAVDAAVVLATDALPYLERSIFQDALIDAFLVSIRSAAAAGQSDAAASLIDRAELVAYARDWAPLKALCIVERARLRLPQTIDAETVVAVGDEERAVLDPLSSQGRAFALLSEIRAYEAIANGDRPRLTAVAERLLRLASNGDDAELRATATLFNILPQLSGRCDKMVELETVRFLNHAASAGFRRTIVDVLDVTGVRAVQNFCSEAYASDCFLALLKLAEPSRRNPVLEGTHAVAPGEAFSFLTEREIEILSALNAGESNKEIARTLHLAPETVKWHLKNVMRKLRAGSREEAVANAATLGLKLIEYQRTS
ncbi:helix-turn-helix transcriptional regulator [Sphingopyxis sp. YR583]|uniref:helix-turn-helix transcriptional regulator n=1 Tax=Sphingopyxis sp. YR583 TaxID=1881047 RepID=UPI0015A5202F|nr:LuxR C-terminal-related transcriptional regulator [Sphingopyxis sp. YR583]